MGKLFSTHSIVEICNVGLDYTQGYPQQLWVTGGPDALQTNASSDLLTYEVFV